MSEEVPERQQDEPEKSGGLWGRLKDGLKKTRGQLADGVGNLLLGEKEIDDTVMEDLETALLLTDVGVSTTQAIMESLAGSVKRRQLNNTVALHHALADELRTRLAAMEKPLVLDVSNKPAVVLFVGVNGVGKTTTIGKLARRLENSGQSVLLAAGDTFRAAAVEQLKSWGDRNGVSVVAQEQGSDSASVVFDAVQAGRARGIDVVLADTAGRLQAKTNLMEELTKIRRVVSRVDSAAPHEVILVLDAGVGQNALSQVREFDAAVGVTGLVVTKLDGTSKAGVVFAIAEAFDREEPMPIYFIGVGEQVRDLRPFNADEFVDALLTPIASDNE